jgi:hypothetical protein
MVYDTYFVYSLDPCMLITLMGVCFKALRFTLIYIEFSFLCTTYFLEHILFNPYIVKILYTFHCVHCVVLYRLDSYRFYFVLVIYEVWLC